MEVFFTLIFAVLLVGTIFLYQTRVLHNSYLRFKVQHPTSDSTQITAGAPKVPMESPVPLDAP